MKKYMRVFFPVLFLCLLIISGISVKMIHDIGNYGTLINYVGIVRGGVPETREAGDKRHRRR